MMTFCYGISKYDDPIHKKPNIGSNNQFSNGFTHK